MKRTNDIKQLSRWLITKGETSLLKIQKLLFFLRVEELKNNDAQDSYFKSNHNFESWIYGPVNKESFYYLQPWYNDENEIEEYLLSEQEAKIIDKKYLKYYEKYANYSPKALVNKSHKNLAWLKAREGYGADEICHNLLEEDANFIEFQK